MPLSRTVATVTLESIGPYSQSRKHEEPKLEGETNDDYNKRVWRAQMLVEDGTVRLPASGIHQALVAAGKYSKIQIPGQGKATWTQKFQAGIALFENPDLGIKPDDVTHIDIYANADGVRGSGKRVMRRFPQMPKWSTTFDIQILDPIITRDIFDEIVEIAGMFVGIGRYRPQNGGTNGRFQMTKLDWKEDRKTVTKKAA